MEKIKNLMVKIKEDMLQNPVMALIPVGAGVVGVILVNLLGRTIGQLGILMFILYYLLILVTLVKDLVCVWVSHTLLIEKNMAKMDEKKKYLAFLLGCFVLYLATGIVENILLGIFPLYVIGDLIGGFFGLGIVEGLFVAIEAVLHIFSMPLRAVFVFLVGTLNVLAGIIRIGVMVAVVMKVTSGTDLFKMLQDKLQNMKKAPAKQEENTQE